MNIRNLTDGALMPADASRSTDDPAPERNPRKLAQWRSAGWSPWHSASPILRGAGRRWYRRPVQRHGRECDQAALRDALRLPGRLSRPAAWFLRGRRYREVPGHRQLGSAIPHGSRDVYSFDRGEGETDAWTCNEDPWITPAIYPNEGGWPDGHTCQLQSQRGGDDWTTDTNPSVSFASAMCFNDLWRVSLAGCWGNDDVTVTGPSAAILRAWNTA